MIHHLDYKYELGDCKFEGSDADPTISCFGVLAGAGGTGLSGALCCDGRGSPVNWELQIFTGISEPVFIPPAEWPLCPPPGPESCPCELNEGGGCNSDVCTTSREPIRYSSGSIILSANDLEATGFGRRWGHTRNFQNRLSGNQHIGQGYNWQVEQWPFLVVDYDGNAVQMGQATGVLWFDKVGAGYVTRFDQKARLELVAGESVYCMTAQDGSKTEFDQTTGMFRKFVSPSGETIEVTGMSVGAYNFTSVDRSVTLSGVTTTEQFQYEYIGPWGDALLEKVTLRRKVGAGAWVNVLRVVYTYYGPNELHGGLQDLKTATTQSWNGASWDETGTSLYRYYPEFNSNNSSSSSSSSSGGGATGWDVHAHLLKLVLNPASYVRMEADGLDPLTASDSQMALYADHYFEYDDQRRVTKEMVQGGSQTYQFAYASSGFADGYNSWKTRTTETLPDGNQNIVYCNYAGLPMLRVFRSGSDEWLSFVKYDSNGRPILEASPSAVTGHDETKADLLYFQTGSGRYQYLRDNDGLIRTKTHHACSGYIASEGLRKGQLGTLIKLREYEYACCGEDCGTSSSSSSSSSSSAPCSHGVWFTSKETIYPSDTNQSKTIATSFTYTFYQDTCAIRERITTLPAIPIDQNGTGIAATRREYFDIDGNLTWSMNERGYITRTKYDIPTGAMTQRIDDVDTSVETDAPDGWTTPSDGGLNLVTDYEHDSRGRMTQSLGPSHTIDINGTATTIRHATWINYIESISARMTRTGQGYATGDSPSYTFTLVNPLSITVSDLAGKLLQQVQTARASTSGKLLPSDTFDQSEYTRWLTVQYSDCCNIASRRTYYAIPISGEGTEGVNYDQMDFGYDVMKRRNRTVTPGGTITRLVFDARGLVTATWVGTNDNGATANDPSGGGLDPDNNMVVVTSNIYDGGEAGFDGNLTEQTQHVSVTESRVTAFVYDWRDRRFDTDGEIDLYQRVTYDNLDRVVETRRYDTDDTGNLIAKSETKYDDRGRIFRAIRYGVNPSTGVVGNSLADNTWFDPAGNVLEGLPSGSKLFTKAVYDSLGRRTIQYLGYTPEPSGSSSSSSSSGGRAPDSVENDVILEQSESVYDDASNVVESIVRQRYHNASDTQLGPLADPANDPKARVTYVATYPDPIGRAQATADYGTHGGTALTRSDTVPTPSDDILVSFTGYDEAGNKLSATDPSGMVTRMGYDDLGRAIEEIQNYQEVSSSSSSSSSCDNCCDPPDDANVTVHTSYNADGNVETLVAINAATGDQVTTYVYGTTLEDSGVATSTLKRKEVYPDSVDEDDVIAFAYNRQGQVTTRTDQNGTVHSYDYDLLARMSQDRVTTVGTGVDDAVLRIGTTYEVRGLREKVTSYDDPEVGSGNILNEVQSEYNDFGQLITEYQSHDGAVNTMSTPKIQYDYADGSDNTIRKSLLIYPSGRQLTYSYGGVGEIADASSRVKSIVDDDDTHLVDYEYLGRGVFVVADDTEPEVRWTMVDLDGEDDPDTGDIYSGLDRFGRTKDNRWFKYDAEEDVDRLQYGYDRASNRLWRKNLVARSLSRDFDELYTYDAIHRLRDMRRGLLNATQTALTSQAFAQCWTLDSTGNWSRMREAEVGAGWTLQQTRTSSEVNEIIDITNTLGGSWAQPAYDRAGNMITMPQPMSASDARMATYDAWNRLTTVSHDSAVVGRYIYDGLRRRIARRVSDHSSSSSGPSCSNDIHVFFTADWREIEERIASTSLHTFVWGCRYIDDLVLRDRNIDGPEGSSRLYAAQDANWNVTTAFGATGDVRERFSYLAYGLPLYWSASYEHSEVSCHDWRTLYAGYGFLAEAGLLSARNRCLHPLTGAWLTRDSIDLSYPSLYQYCDCCPLTCTDPYGLESLMCSIINEEPYKTITSCLCLLIGLLDAAAKSLPISPATTIALNIVDCLCDTIALLQQGCDCRGPHTVGLLGTGLGGMMSCAFDLASIFGPGLDFLDSNLDDFIVQLLPILFSEMFTNSPGGAGGGVSACVDILKGKLWS